jgi:hypothetical protein
LILRLIAKFSFGSVRAIDGALMAAFDRKFFTRSVITIDGAIKHARSQMILRSMVCYMSSFFFMDFVAAVYVVFPWLFLFY